ncbi:MAG TPA: subtype I-B CRISPR-associated endonuclease Cas1 [Prevotella sp.]|nr:subtype I-B CRISPR-associated endonuclease Cas1 [Prevotella sp.]
MKRTFYLFSSGRLERKDNTLKFTPIKDDEGEEQELPPRYLPVEDIAEIYAFGSLRTNSSLFNFLGQKDIPVHYYDYYENYTGSFMPRDGLLAGRVLLAQAKTYENKKRRTELARKFIQGAAWNMVQNLNYYNRRGKELTDPVTQMKQLTGTLEQTKSVEEVMGIEGNIRKIYYACFDTIIDDFSMGERTKQPPQNEVNALISFGNMMCYSETLRAIHQTQLNPTISFLHTPGERRYSLSLDISEIFKPILVDRVIFKTLNKRILSEQCFDKQLNRCLLNDKGKKLFVKAMEDRYDETFRHRSLGRNVSYRHLIKLECYKLLKDIMGLEEYKPFKMYW